MGRALAFRRPTVGGPASISSGGPGGPYGLSRLRDQGQERLGPATGLGQSTLTIDLVEHGGYPAEVVVQLPTERFDQVFRTPLVNDGGVLQNLDQSVPGGFVCLRGVLTASIRPRRLGP